MKQVKGQFSIFDFLKPDKKRTLNDYWHAEAIGKPIRLTSEELKLEQERIGENVGWWFLADVPKCCECYPILKQTKHWLNPLSYAECIVCGRHTKPIDDYSWQGTRKAWVQLMNNELTENQI